MGGKGLGEEGGPRLSSGIEVETFEYLWSEVPRKGGQTGHREPLRPAEELRLDSAKPWREPRSFFPVSCLLPPVPPALLWPEGRGRVDGVGEGQVKLGFPDAIALDFSPSGGVDGI